MIYAPGIYNYCEPHVQVGHRAAKTIFLAAFAFSISTTISHVYAFIFADKLTVTLQILLEVVPSEEDQKSWSSCLAFGLVFHFYLRKRVGGFYPLTLPFFCKLEEQVTAEMDTERVNYQNYILWCCKFFFNMIGLCVESKNLCYEGANLFTISFVTVSYFNKR